MSKSTAKKSVFHLYIPHLLNPLQSWYQDFLFEVEAINLSELLKQTQIQKQEYASSLERAFFHTLYPEVSELPIAYFRHQVQQKLVRKGLICADPVHLEVSMNDVTLTQKITDLTDDEAQELIHILNDHFAQDNLEFVFGSNQCWYLSFPENETVKTYDLASVLLKDIVNKSAESENRNWSVIQNETQMLLHNSEINRQRELAGLKPVNSLWFWGAGKPQVTNLEIEKIYYQKQAASQLRAELFTKAANCEAQPLTDNISSLLVSEESNPTTNVLLLDQLTMPALENNLEAFQASLEKIDTAIIKPLLRAWQKNKIDIVIDCCDGTIFKPQRVSSWQFWLKPKKLREIAL